MLKRNRKIRKFGKKINIALQFMQDIKDFSRYYAESAKEHKDYRYSIMLLVHSLEKGMCFPNPRPFGADKVIELMQMLDSYPDNLKGEFEYTMGISALYSWMEFYKIHEWEDEKAYLNVKKFLSDKTVNPEIKVGSKIYTPIYNSNAEKAFEELFLSRHSVRDYQNKKIELADIQFALKCFVETPTACNRQMCRVIYVSNSNIKDLLNKVTIGLPGFNKNTVQYFIITYDLASFAYSGERQQGLFNAGLCAMNFMYGLHAKGIGSCCLQWSNKNDQDMEVRSNLKLRPSERIAIVIGAGYYLDENLIPCSNRRKAEDIFTVI